MLGSCQVEREPDVVRDARVLTRIARRLRQPRNGQPRQPKSEPVHRGGAESCIRTGRRAVRPFSKRRFP
ncbi:MAG: hypothetical protein BJ554DRAFT_6405 [Olpidium bornovanus]|uniref:Uncharacterized protein n=1 Tax=Olpidium bornovanus TaxID=278681 RepID=A0A8H7ZXU0_9FUNG|nr:MAG: hypothetical protein BJ554DRAFT_6405 [Olpidium bornovanus]